MRAALTACNELLRMGSNQWAHGVVVSHPLSMREALGSIPSVSICHMPRYRSPCLQRTPENVLLDVLPLKARDRVSSSSGVCGVVSESP